MTAGTFALPLVGHSPTGAARTSAAGRRAGLRQFIGGVENRLVETAVRTAVQTGPTPFNPLVLYGPSGVGKSHVAIGLARTWKACFGQANVVYMAATDLCRWMNGPARNGNAPPVRRQAEHRLADYLVIDNLDSIAQSPAAQRELVFALDAVVKRGGQVVIAATVDPARNRSLMAPLRSRLSAGLVVPIAPPESATRARILRELATGHGIALSASCVQLLAEGGGGPARGIRRTVPELLGMLMQLEFEARSEGRTIDEPQVVAFLASQAESCPLTVEKIALAVARHFQLTVDELRSPSRKRALVLARGVAAYLARKHTVISYVALGRWFGGRDHTTVMHACEKVELSIKSDETLAATLRDLESALEATKGVTVERL